jgi:hypothetical protein
MLWHLDCIREMPVINLDRDTEYPAWRFCGFLRPSRQILAPLKIIYKSLCISHPTTFAVGPEILTASQKKPTRNDLMSSPREESHFFSACVRCGSVSVLIKRQRYVRFCRSHSPYAQGLQFVSWLSIQSFQKNSPTAGSCTVSPVIYFNGYETSVHLSGIA